MYKKVVVPLDGSKLAELALPHLEEIAKGCSIPEILLISVTEKVTSHVSKDIISEDYIAPRKADAQPSMLVPYTGSVVYASANTPTPKVKITLGKMAKTASNYLCKVAEGLEKKGFRVTAIVLYGNPAEQIVYYVNEQKADLIVMASTGKSKISRWDMSRIAAKVIKDIRVPVLLIKPAPGFKETKSKRRGVAT